MNLKLLSFVFYFINLFLDADRALAGVITVCSSARHLTLAVPLSTMVYNLVLANLTLRG